MSEPIQKFTIEEYGVAAMVIKLYLDEFCDKSLVTTDQIADAARSASKEIKRLRDDNDWLTCVAKQINSCFTCKDASVYTNFCHECFNFSKWRFKYKTTNVLK